MPAPAQTQFATYTPTSLNMVTPAPTEHVASSGTVTGKTTFQELLDWGLSKDTIQQVIGGDIPVTSTGVKDYVTGKGLEFTSIKTLLQAAVDKLK